MKRRESTIPRPPARRRARARAVFPFVALVGQEVLQQALLLVAIDPSIGACW